MDTSNLTDDQICTLVAKKILKWHVEEYEEAYMGHSQEFSVWTDRSGCGIFDTIHWDPLSKTENGINQCKLVALATDAIIDYDNPDWQRNVCIDALDQI